MTARIVFFLSALETGGAERQTVLLAKRLAELGYTSEILSYYEKYSASILDDDARSRVHFAGGRAMRNIAEWPLAWSALERLKPDVVVAVNLSPLQIAMLGRACGRLHTPIVCTFHTTILPDLKSRLMFPAARLALRFADSLVYVCQAQADYWQVRRLRARSSTVIHNGVDMARYATAEIAGSAADAKMRLGFAPDDYVIGLIAAFRPEKNHPQALAALHALRREGLPAKLLLVGVGPQHADIVERVRSQGLSDLVHFAGDQRDVRPFQKAMDVGMLCSTRGETFSMAALETMAMGVPMVMPALSGCVELVEGGVGGRLFETGNTTALVAALRELHDPALRAIAAKEAHETVTARFTEAIMVEKYRVLIDRLARR